ncbi:DHHC palmitoyltransferase [Nitzschia inconspicua]|uniref:Palmitoyltransferase n=1 Tax=Nitzschia inconspicua TaxID=303405 RepID=A0A9K3KNH8_9STRA|nr:DHHC palmitoyltransferase [Nitzschia inconspicua]
MSSSPSLSQQQSVYIQHWHDTWTGFNRALRSTTEDFKAFQWTLRLIQAAIGYAYGKTGLYRLQLHIYWRPCVPAVGISLIILVILAYYTSLRSIIQSRWCRHDLTVTVNNKHSCSIIYLHDGIVAYLGIMILYHMSSACFQSPGVAVPNDDSIENHLKPNVTTKVSTTDEINSSPSSSFYAWTSTDARGGCCCIDPILDISKERRLTQMYFCNDTSSKDPINRKQKRPLQSASKNVFPDPSPTTCQQCHIQRPPRCHHCYTCHRCILQYDHHCVWLNNCVGWGNYRHFFLTVANLTLGCWYGTALLYRPFYEPLKLQLQEHGWKNLFYGNLRTGILNLPPLTTLLLQLGRGQLAQTDLVKLIFPLLAMVGVLQTAFLGYHVLYVCNAYTTLEYKILLEMQYQALLQGDGTWENPVNPFSTGSKWNNLRHTLGPWYLIGLPVSVEPSFPSLLTVKRKGL